MNFESGPPKQEEFNINTFRNRLKVIGGTVMIFGVSEAEVDQIRDFASKSKSLELQTTDLSESEMRRHKISDSSKKYGVVLGYTIGSEKKLFEG